jgi:hypothetical protein
MAKRSETMTDESGVILKRCAGPCNGFKPLESFGFKSVSSGYRRSKCQPCRTLLERQYKAKHDREYYITHSDEIRAKSKQYFDDNRKACLAYKKAYNLRNRLSSLVYMKTYNKARSKEHVEYCKAYNRRRRHDIAYRLPLNLRARFNKAIKRGFKSGSSVNDLGCSIPWFKAHIESMFYVHAFTGLQMTWDNWAIDGWHMDHVIPLSAFDLTNREQVLKACHYTNLQPLWADHNLSKNDRILTPEQLEALKRGNLNGITPVA